MGNPELSIERAGYPTINLDVDGGGPYGLQQNTAGTGMAPIIPRFREGAADGVQYDGDKVGAGAIDLGMILFAEDRVEMGERIRALRNLLRWRKDRPPAILVASYADGQVLELPVVYSSGLEHDYMGALPSIYQCVVGLMTPHPFWVSRDALEFNAGGEESATPFLDDFAGLPVAPSTVLGSFTAHNPGDVDSDLTVVVSGPSTGLITVTVNGRGWTFTQPLAGSDRITATRTQSGVKVTDQTGANRYRDLGPAPKFPRLAPGDNTISVSMVGATSASRISGYYRPTYEGIY